VQAIDRIHREALEQPRVDHGLGALAMFFVRLKDEIHRAVEVAALRKLGGRTHQHGGVAVMTTGVHAAFVLRAVRK